MYCGYCGTKLNDDARFCFACGKPTILGAGGIGAPAPQEVVATPPAAVPPVNPVPAQGAPEPVESAPVTVMSEPAVPSYAPAPEVSAQDAANPAGAAPINERQEQQPMNPVQPETMTVQPQEGPVSAPHEPTDARQTEDAAPEQSAPAAGTDQQVPAQAAPSAAASQQAPATAANQQAPAAGAGQQAPAAAAGQSVPTQQAPAGDASVQDLKRDLGRLANAIGKSAAGAARSAAATAGSVAKSAADAAERGAAVQGGDPQAQAGAPNNMLVIVDVLLALLVTFLPWCDVDMLIVKSSFSLPLAGWQLIRLQGEMSSMSSSSSGGSVGFVGFLLIALWGLCLFFTVRQFMSDSKGTGEKGIAGAVIAGAAAIMIVATMMINASATGGLGTVVGASVFCWLSLLLGCAAQYWRMSVLGQLPKAKEPQEGQDA